jgi:hypothetical protein
MNKHVKNFTELFESSQKEVSTDDLIVLAETGIISWKEAVNTVFDRGELAFIYWQQGVGTERYVWYIAFNDRVICSMPETYYAITRKDSEKMDMAAINAAYDAGAKMTIRSFDEATVRYDNNNQSVKLSHEDLKSITTTAMRSINKFKKQPIKLSENFQEEVRVDDLIGLVEADLIDWKTVIDTTFDRGDLAVVRWIVKSYDRFQPAAVFTGGKIVYGKETVDLTKREAKELADRLAYSAGAKITIRLWDHSVKYDPNKASVRLPEEVIDHATAVANRSLIMTNDLEQKVRGKQ